MRHPVLKVLNQNVFPFRLHRFTKKTQLTTFQIFRWEVAVAPSLDGFKQMSFVNSIATTKGGRHIDHVSKLIENALTDTLKKKNKGGMNVKPHQVHTLQYC